jgi:hypothetical protein
MFYFIVIVMLIIVLYQHTHIRNHIKYDKAYKEVLTIKRELILNLYKKGTSIPKLTSMLYKKTKKDYKAYKLFMARVQVEKIICEYYRGVNEK